MVGEAPPEIAPAFRVTRVILAAAPLWFLVLFWLGNVMRYDTPFPTAEAYSHAQYLFDWRDWGFVKRGLIATLFPQTPETAAPFAAWFGVAAGGVVILASSWLLWTARQPVALMVLMASPFFVYQLGYILGRLDAVGIAWFVIWLGLRQTGQLRAAEILYALSPILLFVHEVFLLTILSAMFMVRNLDGFALRQNLWFGILTVAAFAVVVGFGRYEGDESALQAYFQHHFGPDNLTQYVLTWELGENLAMTYHRHFPIGAHSSATLAVLAAAVLGFALAFRIQRLWVFALTTLGFVTVFALGHDWGRWVALYISMIGIGLATTCPLRPGVARMLERWLIPLMIVSVLLTPANITRLFIELLFLVRDQNFERLLN